MDNKKKQFIIIPGDRIHLLCMRGIVPGEVEEINIVLATFNEKQLPLDAKEQANAICDLLNSQASAIQLLLDENYALKRKVIELYHKIIPFGGPDGGG